LEPGLLPIHHCRVHPEDRWNTLLRGLKAVHADDHPAPCFEFLLLPVGRLADLPLNVPQLDRPQHAPDLMDLVQVRLRPLLDLRGQGLDVK